MNRLLQPINAEYPKHNKPIFEEWFYENYKGCNTDRKLLDVFFTSYYVNNNYGKDIQGLQVYLDDLDWNGKYFTIVQYDDGILNNLGNLDILQFNMSKNIGVTIPLLCRPHPFKFDGGKKWFANFIGSKTHPIRESAESLKQFSDYYISFEPHDIEQYCKILHESMFTLCYRGYGANSFRVAEAIQFGSIPVVISDEFINPYDFDFDEFGVRIKAEDAYRIDEILQSIEVSEIVSKQDKLEAVYESLYTFDANYNHITNHLEAEYHNRQQN